MVEEPFFMRIGILELYHQTSIWHVSSSSNISLRNHGKFISCVACHDRNVVAGVVLKEIDGIVGHKVVTNNSSPVIKSSVRTDFVDLLRVEFTGFFKCLYA